MRTRNIASVQQNTLHRLWYKAAQWDRIRLRLLERLVFAIGIQSGAFYIVQIKEEIRLGNYPVFKGTSLRNILLIQLIIRLKPAGFTHTDHIGTVDQITAFISRHMAAQKCINLGKLLSARKNRSKASNFNHYSR